jgi:hypothetical protein
MEDPGSTERMNVLDIDFMQAAVASSGVIAVVRSPIGSDRHNQQVFSADMSTSGHRRLSGLGEQTHAVRGWSENKYDQQ